MCVKERKRERDRKTRERERERFVRISMEEKTQGSLLSLPGGITSVGMYDSRGRERRRVVSLVEDDQEVMAHTPPPGADYNDRIRDIQYKMNEAAAHGDFALCKELKSRRDSLRSKLEERQRRRDADKMLERTYVEKLKNINHELSLLNQERSKLIATNHNFGIAEALVKQFSLKPRSSGLITYNIEG